MIKVDLTQKPPAGQMIRIQEGKHNILLANAGGKLFAVTDKCPHLGCSLAKGQLDGTVVTCPCHGSTFDVTTGSLINWIANWPGIFGKITKKLGLAKNLKTFKLTEEADGILIED